MITFPREIGLKRQLCSSKNQFSNYVKKLGGRSSCYTSLYHYENLLPNQRRVDYSSAVMDRAWWDFDAGPRGDIDAVKDDVWTLLQRLEGDVRVVATGRGFHIHQMFDEPIRGHDWEAKLNLYQREVAKGLPTLDGVAHSKKLTRIPGTFNPKRWRWAVNIDVDLFIKDPHGYEIPIKPDPKLNYRDPFTGETVVDGFKFKSWCSQNTSLLKPKPFIMSADIQLPVAGTGDIPIPPCLEAHIHHENPPHHVRVALAQHLFENLRLFGDAEMLSQEQKKHIEDEMTMFMKSLGWRDFSEHETRKHVRSILKYNRSPSCAWFKARNMCSGPCWRYDYTVNLESA
mgnify:CR=1 FL=1